MKKRLMIQTVATLMLLFCNATKTFADEQVVIKSKSGDEVAYVLKEKPVITYEGNTLVLTVSGVRAEYPLSDVENLTFDGVANGISLPTKDGSTTGTISVDANGMILSGFRANTEVTVFRADGQIQGRYVTNADGFLQITLTQKGLYLITVDRSTFKITHK